MLLIFIDSHDHQDSLICIYESSLSYSTGFMVYGHH